MKHIETEITEEQYQQLLGLAQKKGMTLEELCREIFTAGAAETIASHPCKCWDEANKKLKPMGVVLSNKLLTFRPTEDLDLELVHQLPTEPIGGGKFKASMPRYIGFPRCPFCGQLYARKEAA